MLQINWYSHKPFLVDELKRLIPENSFVSYLWRSLGAELHYRLVDWEPQSEVEFSSSFPVDALFAWVTKDGGLDPEWLASEDGSYLDDDGKLMPPTVKPSYTAVEQLASYGLWLISRTPGSYAKGYIPEYGAIPEHKDFRSDSESGANDYGWDRVDLIEHYAACLLLGYQALAYSQKILTGSPLSAEENKRVDQFDFSALGKKGAAKRHAPMAQLRAWAIEKYKAGTWKSANQAAHDLQHIVLEYGRTINAPLSKSNAQRTIANWFTKSV